MLATITRLLELANTNRAAFEQELFQETQNRSELGQWVNSSLENLSQLLAYGKEEYAKGKYEESLIIFQILDALTPQCPEACVLASSSLALLEKWDDALKGALYACYKNPKNPIPFLIASLCYEKLNLQTEKIAFLKQVCKLAKENASYANCLQIARIHLQKQNIDDL